MMRITTVFKYYLSFQLLQSVVSSDEESSAFPEPDYRNGDKILAWRKPFYDELAAIDTPLGSVKDLLVNNGVIYDLNASPFAYWATSAVSGGYAVAASRDVDGSSYDCRDQMFGNGENQYTTLICDFKEKLEAIILQEEQFSDKTPEAWADARIYASSGEILKDVDIMTETLCWNTSPSEDCRSLPDNNPFVGLVSQLQFLIQTFVPRGFEFELLADGALTGIAGASIMYQMNGSRFAPNFAQINFGKYWFTSYEEGFDNLPISIPIKFALSALAIATISDDYLGVVSFFIEPYFLSKYSSELFEDDTETAEFFDYFTISSSDLSTCAAIIGVDYESEGKTIEEMIDFLRPFLNATDTDQLYNDLCSDFDAESYEKAKANFVRSGGQSDSDSDEDGGGSSEEDGKMSSKSSKKGGYSYGDGYHYAKKEGYSSKKEAYGDGFYAAKKEGYSSKKEAYGDGFYAAKKEAKKAAYGDGFYAKKEGYSSKKEAYGDGFYASKKEAYGDGSYGKGAYAKKEAYGDGYYYAKKEAYGKKGYGHSSSSSDDRR